MTRRTITRDDGTSVSDSDHDPHQDAEDAEAHRRRLSRWSGPVPDHVAFWGDGCGAPYWVHPAREDVG